MESVNPTNRSLPPLFSPPLSTTKMMRRRMTKTTKKNWRMTTNRRNRRRRTMWNRNDLKTTIYSPPINCNPDDSNFTLPIHLFNRSSQEHTKFILSLSTDQYPQYPSCPISPPFIHICIIYSETGLKRASRQREKIDSLEVKTL